MLDGGGGAGMMVAAAGGAGAAEVVALVQLWRSLVVLQGLGQVFEESLVLPL